MRFFCLPNLAREIATTFIFVALPFALYAETPADAPDTSTPSHVIDMASAQADSTSQSPSLPDEPQSSNKLAASESSSRTTATAPANGLASLPASPDEKFNLKGALLQSFSVTVFFEAWRTAFDPSLRYQVAHKPFFHDWFVSYTGYNMKRWGDGDDFIVNDVGHPLEGAVFARNFLINSPRSQVAIGKNSRYWTSRLKALAWAAAWSTQTEIGPLSETNFGNQGGWTYVPGCGTYLSCLNNPKYPKPPTNNTGWTDFVITPTIGVAWVLGEDTIDKYIVSPIAENHRIFGGRILRSALEPSRSFAALFAGKFPWMLPQYENNFVVHPRPKAPKVKDPSQPPLDRWGFGTQYTAITLPVLQRDCGCVARQYNSGVGLNLDYNLTRGIALDSSLSLLPSQGGSERMMQGLFGMKFGERWQHFGIFAKVRPGFIFYEKAMPGGGVYTPQSITRFAADFGGVVEAYPSRKSTLRLDVGTTLVRYLTDHSDPRTSELGSLLSNQYIVTQGNFQLSTGYVYRF